MTEQPNIESRLGLVHVRFTELEEHLPGDLPLDVKVMGIHMFPGGQARGHFAIVVRSADFSPVYEGGALPMVAPLRGPEEGKSIQRGLYARIHRVFGQASMCWIEDDASDDLVFDHEAARVLADELCIYVGRQLDKARKGEPG